MGTNSFAVHSAGNILGTTNVNGTSFVTFGSQNCVRLIISNVTGTTIQFKQDNGGVIFPLPNASIFSFEGLNDASQISFKRSDDGTAAVVSYGRWEL